MLSKEEKLAEMYDELEQQLVESQARIKELEEMYVAEHELVTGLEQAVESAIVYDVANLENTLSYVAEAKLDIENELIFTQAKLQQEEAEAAAMREALMGANWIIGKLAPHEILAIVIRNYRPSDDDIATGAKYRAMIDEALSLSHAKAYAERLTAIEQAAYAIIDDYGLIEKSEFPDGLGWAYSPAANMVKAELIVAMDKALKEAPDEQARD